MLPHGATPTCADPAYLPLVDAAFERRGGPEAHLLARKVCPWCPVAEACLAEAMATGEHGPWGATSRTDRTKAGAARAPTANLDRARVSARSAS